MPDLSFDDEISFGSNKQVIAKVLGGHTSGSAIVMCHDLNAVFVGDLIFGGQFPYGGDPTCNPDQWIRSLKEVSSKQYETIIPGHGPVCGQQDLDEYIEALDELKQNIKDALETGISIESFIDHERVPMALKKGFERFGVVTLEHWFNYYA